MTEQEIRIAIAEFCGYRRFESPQNTMNFFHPNGKETCICPNYPKDLNAMHEAEGWLNNEQTWKFTCIIVDITGAESFSETFVILHATASQRAEALLRTIGKWKD